MTASLSTVQPDWNAVVAALQGQLSTANSWQDLYEGSTGQTLIEFMAACLVYEQHSLESLFQETFLDTAKQDVSVYTISRMLGVRITRKSPPTVSVTLSRQNATTPLVIPALTQFTGIDSSALTNIHPIIFDIGALNVVTTLSMGTVQTAGPFLSDGTIFQELRITGSTPFSVADQAVWVTVNGIPWRVVQDGLWNYASGELVVQDKTFGNGDLDLLFGDGTYGVCPLQNAAINVQYIDTQGNDTVAVVAGTQLQVPIAGITGTTTGAMTTGTNPQSSNFYRNSAPYLFNEIDKPVTDLGYAAKIMTYPGVADALVFPQRALDPYDVRLMNVMWVSILIQDGSVWSQEVYAPPPPTFTSIDTSGYLQPGTYSYRVSSVNEVGESKPSVVQGFSASITAVGTTLTLPNVPIATSLTLTDTTHSMVLTSSRTTNPPPSGQYYYPGSGYAVILNSAQSGDTVTVGYDSNGATYSISVQGSVMLRWDLQPGALSYRIYGNTGGAEQFLYEYVPNEQDISNGYALWVDDGSTYSNGLPPTVNTTQASWWTFLQWMAQYQHSSIRLVQYNPRLVPVDISVTVFVTQDADSLAEIRLAAYNNITALFAPQQGSIGRRVAVSDISQACFVPRSDNSDLSYVDYVDVQSPMTDMIPSTRVDFFYANSISVTVGYSNRSNRVLSKAAV